MPNLLNLASSDIAILVFNLLLGLAASGVLALCYSQWGEALANRRHFARVLPLLTLLTIFVISIKVSVVVKIGVLSSLTLVRFRNPTKDPEELLFFFLAVTIGFGLASHQRVATLIGVALVLLFLALMRLLQRRPPRSNLYVCIVAPDADPDNTAVFDQVSATLGAHARPLGIRRLERPSGALQMGYRLTCAPEALTQCLSDLLTRVPDCSFSYTDQSALPER